MTENNNIFSFVSNEFTIEEAILKGQKKYIIEGYISTTDEDAQGEVVTDEAQDDMVRQLKSKPITLDLEHEEWYDEQGKQLPRPKSQMIPVAKVISVERRTSPKNGTYIKAEVNQHLGGKFNMVWNSIKDKFLHAFSIGFYPVEAVTKNVNGKFKSFINKLNLVNITLTGTPVNSGATFNPIMKAALKSMNENKEESKLENETETIEPEVETPVEESTEETTPEAEDKPESETEEESEDESEVESEAEEEKPEDEPAPVPDPKPLDMIKAYKKKVAELESMSGEQVAKIKAQKKEIAKLKAILEKPILKGQATTTPKITREIKMIGPLDTVI